METVAKTISESKSLTIPLEAIEASATNRTFRKASEMSDDALKELAGSINQYGVIQPIVVRPHPEKDGMYLLICGERRFRASLLAGKTEIPAHIKDVSDEVALEMQAIENIERENIHPLNEAKGYRIMLENNNNLTAAELAQRFSKSETYILQRLKLNDLVKEFKKDFYEDKILLGHAVALARLTPADQRETRDEMTGNNGSFGSVKDLQEFIDSRITNSLSAAPFDKEDAMLLPKAGACLACAKRSGASPLLFAEIKEKDKCFDRACFFTKCEKFILNKTRELIETQPDIVFLRDYNDPADAVATVLADHKIKPLKEYEDFYQHNAGGEKAQKLKGFWITGNKAGQLATVHLKKEAKHAPVTEKEGRKQQVEKIKVRMTRSKELDQEKVYAKILEALHKHPSQKKTFEKKLMPVEEVMLWYIVIDKAGFHLKGELHKYLGLSKETPEKMFAALSELKPEEKAFILRKVMLDQYGGNYPASTYGHIIYKIATAYGDIDIAAFEKEQKEICTKREERAKGKIKELQGSKKE
jgi:ParB/RepB/Spo0J family partition protein